MLYGKVHCYMGRGFLFHICYHYVLLYYPCSHRRFCDNRGEYIKVRYDQELSFHPASCLQDFILSLVGINPFQSHSLRIRYSCSLWFCLCSLVFCLCLLLFTRVLLVLTCGYTFSLVFTRVLTPV